MPQSTWNNKRERQYQHIKQSEQKRGTSKDRAEETAARTVNKERAQSGETKNTSPNSFKDLPQSVPDDERSHRDAAGRTFSQLYQEARIKKVHGRSKMNKAQLLRAVS